MTNTLSKDIIAEWGLGNMTPEKQEEIVDRIGKLLYQAILVRALDILSESEQDEFDKILDVEATTPEDVLVFLRSKIPTFEELRSEEKNRLRDELLLIP